MARTFDGSTHELNTSIGSFGSTDGGPVTCAVLAQRGTGGASTGEWVGLHDSSGNPVGVIWRLDGSNHPRMSTDVGDQQSTFTWTNSDGWCVIAANKANGTVAPRFHKYVISTATWTHADAGGTLADSTGALAGAGGHVRFGGGSGGFGGAWNGDIAVVALWNRSLIDAEIEQLEGSLQGWLATAPDGLWLLDQAATGTNVIDTTGNGANQSSLTGTTVVDGVPGFSYGFGVMHAQRVPAAGGSQTIVPTGIASAEAFGTATLGLTISPSGLASAEAFGTAALTLGIAPTGIASAEAFGTASISAAGQISPSGIPSAEAFGTATVSQPGQLAPTGIASAEAFGTPTVTSEVSIIVYCPPVENIVPPVYVGPEHHYPVHPLATKLFRHYKSRAGSRNIYILTDNTVTPTQPWDSSTIRTICFGGHVNQVTATDYALLVAAGYPSSC